MKIVAYNIHYGIGKDSEYDLNRIVDSVRGADIIALQEVERFYGPPHQPAQPEDIAALLPDYYWVFDAAFDLDASEKRNEGTVFNRRMQHGQMLISRWPIYSKRYFPLPRLNVEYAFNMQMGVLEGTIVTPLGPLRIYVVHFGSESGEERVLQSKFVNDLVLGAPDQGGAWTGPAEENADRDWSGGKSLLPMPVNAIVLGDFNMVEGSKEYIELKDSLAESGMPLLVDIYSRLEPNTKVNTWHPNPGRNDNQESAKLDYVFLTSDLVPFATKAWVDESATGSDHQPVWVELDSLWHTSSSTALNWAENTT